MLRLKVAGMLTTVCLLIGGGIAVGQSVAAPPVLAAKGAGRAGVLELFYTPPVVVRAGEPVLIPVDVVCATARGGPCGATVTLAARVQGEQWEMATVPAVKGLRFDATAPATRALAAGGSTGRVDFYLEAADPSGRTFALGSSAEPLSFYVTRSMPVVRINAAPFGHVRRGTAIVSLAWGSGPMNAGLEPGLESATLGPSSFDVDAAGRVYLVDSMQDRVAVFHRDRLVRATAIPVSARADIAVGADGSAFVADGGRGTVDVRRIARSGRVDHAVGLGTGLSWQIRVVDGHPYVNTLPRDAWLSTEPGAALPGMPGGSGAARMIRLGTESSVRVGSVSPDGLADAVEVRSNVSFGDVALAEPDGAGGYLLVVHTWRSDPRPADQYQVIHLREGRVIETFAVANTKFAETPPLSRFRLGGDGALYHLSSTSAGITVDRYALDGGVR